MSFNVIHTTKPQKVSLHVNNGASITNYETV